MRILTPGTVAEAGELLSTESGSVPIAGGTDLLVHWPSNLDAHECTYVDLSGLTELKHVTWTDDHLHLGALATYWDVLQDDSASEELPLLSEAARQVGAIQIQSRGTWAGNVANGSPAADGVTVLMAYDAEVRLEPAGEAGPWIPLSGYYTGYRESVRRAGQLIAEVRIPRVAYDLQFFEKVGARRAQAIAKVGLGVTRSVDGWRVVAASMAPTVRRCPATERLLEEREPISAPADFLPAIRADVSPIDDLRSTAAYRERTMSRLLYFGLRGACPWIS